MTARSSGDSSAGDANAGKHAGESSRFATTSWSLVARAGERDAATARAALETLCGAYWYPLYAFLRRQGRGADEAQELTQAFFCELLEKQRVPQARAERGRFRSFLLASLRNFAANRRRDERALKRGGDRRFESLDFAAGERRYRDEPADRETPERLFERQWATAVTQAALRGLEAEYAEAGKAELFGRLAPLLLDDGGDASHADRAAAWGMSAGAIRTALHRLRLRCRERVREEIARTVADDGEVEDEMRELFTALAR